MVFRHSPAGVAWNESERVYWHCAQGVQQTHFAHWVVHGVQFVVQSTHC
jgi:hypothetical protein